MVTLLIWTRKPLILYGLNFCGEHHSNLTNKSQFSPLGLTFPRPLFLFGEQHTFAGSNQMSQIMGLIQSKLCTELGLGGGGFFWFFSALCRWSKCQACLHPQLAPLQCHKPIRGEAEGEAKHSASYFSQSTNKSSSISRMHLPASCLIKQCYTLWSWLQQQSRKKTCFSVIFLKPKSRFWFSKNKFLAPNLFSSFWKAQS